MKTSEARDIVSQALAAGIIDLDRAAWYQSRITEYASGMLYGSRVSYSRRRRLNAMIVENLQAQLAAK